MTRPGLHVDSVTRPGIGAVLARVDPATGGRVAEVSGGSAADVAEATGSAETALAHWTGRTPGERARVLLRRNVREVGPEGARLRGADHVTGPTRVDRDLI
jgi:acyl-CoA reductase-like NAD-dependent aldehyde dehydrogenase